MNPIVTKRLRDALEDTANAARVGSNGAGRTGKAHLMTSAATSAASSATTAATAASMENTSRVDDSLDERRWAAMIAKSLGTAVGLDPFVIAVRTTGIYCRVGCPAKTPHRHNVHFFDTTAEAVDAGFRACQRCRSDEGDLSPWQPKSKRTPRSEPQTGT